jgi:hypothetical protein
VIKKACFLHWVIFCSIWSSSRHVQASRREKLDLDDDFSVVGYR